MLSEQYFAFVISGHLCTYSTCAGFECLCAFVCESVRVYLCIRLSGLSSSPNGLMGTLWCLSSPLEWDTLRVWGSTKAQPCLWRGVSLWRGATAVLTVAGLMVITLPGRSTLWALRPRTSPLHTPLLRLNRGPKGTPVDQCTSVEQPAHNAIHPKSAVTFRNQKSAHDTTTVTPEAHACTYI